MMNTEIVALCGTAKIPSDIKGKDYSVIKIGQNFPTSNLRLEIENVSHQLLQNISDISLDLLEIASYVYHADGSIKRGTNKDVFSENWVRKYNFVIPVRVPGFWEDSLTKMILIKLLSYLTEDDYNFSFSKMQTQPEQLVFKEISDELPYSPDADCVMLFSGGMDSLSGAVHLNSIGRKPILASHQSNPVISNLQKSLAKSIRSQFPSWAFPHLDITINRMKDGSPALEHSQRSRSFLFFTFGSLIAFELGLNELFVCENGITTFNLPRLGQTLGSMASRSTHPKVIHLFEELVNRVFETKIKLINPFIWKTRAEVIEILMRSDSSSLLPLSSSCNHSRRPKIHPHCGTCSQCVDRRFAIASTELENLDDEIIGYEKDIFFDELSEGEEIMQAMSPVQFSLFARGIDIDQFCAKYGQIYDAIDSLDGDDEKKLSDIYQLHQRYAREIHDVLGIKHSENWHRVFNKEFPDTSLLMLTGAGSDRRSDPLISETGEKLIDKLANCPISKIKPYEDICEDIFTFLFCEDLPAEESLIPPDSQSETDQGYQRRDLVFRNKASNGLWSEIKREFDADGIIVDAKNYDDEIDGNTVRNFSAKYLKKHGLGRFGIIVARQVPHETRKVVSKQVRIPAAIEAQKEEWREDKMVVLLDDDDLKSMLKMKMKGITPSSLISDRIYTLKSRM